MSAHSPSRITDGLLQLVCGEFLEMPGLRLTRQRAQRLLGLYELTCREVLGVLVDAKFWLVPITTARIRG